MPDEERILRRSTVKINKIKLTPTNLKMYTSGQGRHSIIIEDIGSADIVNNLELETQLGIKALELVRQYDIASPCVLDIGSNIKIVDYSPGVAYAKDGLPVGDVVKAINKERIYNRQQTITPDEIQSLLRMTSVNDGVDGQQVTNCFDGPIKNMIVGIGLAEWSKHIIKLTDYYDIISSQIPTYFVQKKRLAVEERNGKVYYLEVNQSLEILINLEQRCCSEYFFGLIKRDIEAIPEAVRQISSITTQLAADNKVSMSAGSYASQLISLINLSGNDRIRALIVITSIFDKIQIDIEYSTVINIADVMAAALLLLFIPNQAISDETYITTLRVLLSFLTMTPLDSYYNYDVGQLRNSLSDVGWKIVNHIVPDRLQIRK